MVNESNIQQTEAAFRDGRIVGDFLPSCYGIEVTRHCNLACVMCPNPTFSAAEKGHMNMDTFSQVIDRISETAEVVKLHWVGEPLLHPRLLEMIRYARRNISGLLFFSTNATLLRGTLAEAIRVSGLDKIVLSLDGMSAASYEAVRKKGSFEEVFTNIETFVTSVDERGGPLCEIQMIVTDFNKHEIDAFKRKWASFKNTAVNVTWLTDWAGNIPDRHLISEARNPGHASPRQACSDLWFKMQIAWNGDVNLCCLDARRTVLIGNLCDASLSSLWQSGTILGLRRQHLQNRFPGICASCTDWAQPQEYEFWYSMKDYQSDPNKLWSAPMINAPDTQYAL